MPAPKLAVSYLPNHTQFGRADIFRSLFIPDDYDDGDDGNHFERPSILSFTASSASKSKPDHRTTEFSGRTDDCIMV